MCSIWGDSSVSFVLEYGLGGEMRKAFYYLLGSGPSGQNEGVVEWRNGTERGIAAAVWKWERGVMGFGPGEIDNG